ncbi:MAG: hypothetical protein IJA36_06025 [Lachnospiraceae bacterium]|nr:hypothetical protein [Lachnospiraceae bacterium]
MQKQSNLELEVSKTDEKQAAMRLAAYLMKFSQERSNQEEEKNDDL